MTPDIAIAVMARAPTPGRAKTRLIPRLGAVGAARLHEALARRTLAAIAGSGLAATLWCAPDERDPFFVCCAAEFGIALRPQTEGDIGERMAAIFAGATAPTLLIGTDCPTLGADLVSACADALRRGAAAVFLPAEDGGYGLVGLARPIPELFVDMPWGGDQVMAATRARLVRAGVDWAEPATVWDVDRPEDVDRLAAAGFPIPAFAG